MWDEIKGCFRFCWPLMCLALGGFLLGISTPGCFRRTEPERPPVVEASAPSVPTTMFTSLPDAPGMADGETAILLEDAIVYARIPFGTAEFAEYEGPVRLKAGTLLSRPITVQP